MQEQEPYSASKIRASKQRLDSLGYLPERAAVDRAGAPARQDRPRRQRPGGQHRLVPGRRRLRQLFLAVRHLPARQNTNLFGGGESAAFSARGRFPVPELTASATPSRGSWTCRSRSAFRASTTRLYLFSFDQSDDRFPDQQRLSAGRPGTQASSARSRSNTSRPGWATSSKASASAACRRSPLSTSKATRATAGSRRLLPSIRRFTVDNPGRPAQRLGRKPRHGSRGPGRHPVHQGHRARPLFLSRSSRVRPWANGFTHRRSPSVSAPSCRPAPAVNCRCSSAFSRAASWPGPGSRLRAFFARPAGNPVQPVRAVLGVEQVGGSKELLFSQQIGFPILESLGLRGNVFLDAGNAFRMQRFAHVQRLQAAYGIGVFWKSPFGPLSGRHRAGRSIRGPTTAHGIRLRRGSPALARGSARSSARSPTLAKDAPDQLIMSSEESRAVPAPRGAARVRRASYSRPVSADGRIVISMRQRCDVWRRCSC